MKGQHQQWKLPKLKITKFNGTHIDWFRFWNQFKAEIDNTAQHKLPSFPT